VHRLDVRQFADVVLLEPGEKRARRPVIGLACVPVADRRGEEFEEAACGLVASGGDRGRDHNTAGDRCDGLRPGFDDELVHAFSVT
jgi:hypothetical protein